LKLLGKRGNRTTKYKQQRRYVVVNWSIICEIDYIAHLFRRINRPIFSSSFFFFSGAQSSQAGPKKEAIKRVNDVISGATKLAGERD
jgi:hypothetical protein